VKPPPTTTPPKVRRPMLENNFMDINTSSLFKPYIGENLNPI
jgi:hypothetical protein